MILREIQWRESDEEAWHEGQRLPLDQGEALEVDGLEVGVLYDIRVRAVDDDVGTVGPWRVISGVLPVVPDEYPDAPTGLRLVGGCLTWHRSPQQNVVGYLVRSHPGTREHWPSAEEHHDEALVQPPFPLCSVPSGPRTLLVRAVDEYGNESAEAVLRTDRAPMSPTEPNVIQSRDEAALGWTGTFIAGAVGGTGIWGEASSSNAAFVSDLEPAWLTDDTIERADDEDAHHWFVGDALPDDPDDDTVNPWARYEDLVYQWDFAPCEGWPGAIVTVDVVTTAPIWRLYWRVHDDPAWPANENDAAWGDDADPDDGPQPAWRLWTGAHAVPQAHVVQFMLWAHGGAVIPQVSGIVTSLSVPGKTQSVDDLFIPVGGTRVPLVGTWRAVLDCSATLLQAQTGSGVAESRIVDLDHTNGPHIALVDSSGEPTTGRVSATVHGY